MSASNTPSVPKEIHAAVEQLEAWTKEPMIWASLGPQGVGRIQDAVEEIRHVLTMHEGPVYPR